MSSEDKISQIAISSYTGRAFLPLTENIHTAMLLYAGDLFPVLTAQGLIAASFGENGYLHITPQTYDILYNDPFGSALLKQLSKIEKIKGRKSRFYKIYDLIPETDSEILRFKTKLDLVDEDTRHSIVSNIIKLNVITSNFMKYTIGFLRNMFYKIDTKQGSIYSSDFFEKTGNLIFEHYKVALRITEIIRDFDWVYDVDYNDPVAIISYFMAINNQDIFSEFYLWNVFHRALLTGFVYYYLALLSMSVFYDTYNRCMFLAPRPEFYLGAIILSEHVSPVFAYSDEYISLINYAINAIPQTPEYPQHVVEHYYYLEMLQSNTDIAHIITAGSYYDIDKHKERQNTQRMRLPMHRRAYYKVGLEGLIKAHDALFFLQQSIQEIMLSVREEIQKEIKYT